MYSSKILKKKIKIKRQCYTISKIKDILKSLRERKQTQLKATIKNLKSLTFTISDIEQSSVIENRALTQKSLLARNQTTTQEKIRDGTSKQCMWVVHSVKELT